MNRRRSSRQDEDRRAFTWLAAKPLRDFPAVHFRHRDIEQIRFGFNCSTVCRCSRPLAALLTTKPSCASRVFDQLALHGEVIDHQDRSPRPGVAAHPDSPSLKRCADARLPTA